ncbi:MAG: hypothetical protein WCA95_05525 [Opitutaceae bacterium]
MSVLSAPPPPPPGSSAEPPVPGGIPRLSLSTPHLAPHDKSGGAKPNLGKKAPADVPLKLGVKPPVKAGKPGAVLRKRAALGPVAKAGVAVVVVAILIGGIYSYRIFFPGRDVTVKAAPIAKPPVKSAADAAADLLKKAAAEPGKLIDNGQNAIAARRAAEQAKIDAAMTGQEPTPTPTPTPETVMVQSNLTSDVKVNSTRIEAAPAASAAFRTYVASANIGGVFQGTPSRALINGTIWREGQMVESVLQITFDRIDSVNKVIYFKDSTGAEVSKSY